VLPMKDTPGSDAEAATYLTQAMDALRTMRAWAPLPDAQEKYDATLEWLGQHLSRIPEALRAGPT